MFPGIASKKMPMRILHRIIAAEGSIGLYPHFKVSRSGVYVLDALDPLTMESFSK